MNDIVPELLAAIQASFADKVAADRELKKIKKKIEAEAAEMTDGHAYAERLGEILSDVLLDEITPEALPDGTLYYNIADRAIRPMIEQNHDMINLTAADIQRIIDAAQNIGLAPVQPEIDKGRVDGLIDKMSGAEDYRKWLGEPIVNIAEHSFDEYVRKNADFRHKAGFEPKIVRTLGTSEVRRSKKRIYQIPCAWCRNLAGIYNYYDVYNTGNDVFRRHEGCRCVVTYQNGSFRQNVHTRDTWENPVAAYYERQQARNNIIQSLGEYIRNATPGKGNISKASDFKEKGHSEEIAFSNWIFQYFGGDIRLNEDKKEKRYADYLWNGKLWELKTISSSNYNTIDQHIRDGNKQINENRGGIFLDISNSELTISEIESYLEKILAERKIFNTDIIIRKGAETGAIRLSKE